MNIRQNRRFLWAFGIVWLCVGASAAVLGWILPYRLPGADKQVAPPAVTQDTSRTRTHINLASFKPVWKLELRRPLYDPPPTKAAKEEFAPPPFPARLIGTVIEPTVTENSAAHRNSVAMFLTQQGIMELRRIGDDIAGGNVVRIAEGTATVRYYDKDVILTVEKER